MEVVCIGGHNDGKRVLLPDHTKMFEVAIERDGALISDITEAPKFETEAYFVERLTAGPVWLHLGRPFNQTLVDTIKLLVTKYPKPGERK